MSYLHYWGIGLQLLVCLNKTANVTLKLFVVNIFFVKYAILVIVN